MKRFFALYMAFCICISCLCLNARAADIDPEQGDRANSWRYEDGQPIMDPSRPAPLADPSHPNATAIGIDVSHHQGLIDWEDVQDAGIRFAIIRCGYGMDLTEQDDRYFEYNASECERLGIPYGVYLYSYATTTERASSEADHALRLLEGYSPSLPIYYDLEDNSIVDADLAAIAETFCSKISDAGYPVGVYANLYWWNNYLTDPCFDDWYRWVAQHNTTCTYAGDYQLWQYSDSGSVDGISTNVDLNFLIGYPDDHGGCALHHRYASVVTPPTCTEYGYTTYTCTVCGDSYVDSYVESKGHSFGAWSVITKPTCTEKGKESRSCACGLTETREVQPKGHSFGDWSAINGPTCTEKGKESRSCACGLTEERIVDALGHSYQGSSCTVCGELAPDYNDEIFRIFGAGRCETAYKVADELKTVLGVDTFDSIIIAGGDNFADALAGSYLAAVKKAPILLYRKGYEDENLGYIQKNLAEGGTVYILGGTSTVSQEMEDALSAYTVQRLAGPDRFATNLAILEEAGVGDKEILVVTGYNFADSLSASATGLPILLVNSSSGMLSAEQGTFLGSLGGSKLTIVGGTNSVSEVLADALGAYGTVSRVSGVSREDTSIEVAKTFFTAPGAVVLAYSRNFPDGLCGGPLAYAMGAPLLLTNDNAEAAATGYVTDLAIASGYVLGGTSLVSDRAVRTIFSLHPDEYIAAK